VLTVEGTMSNLKLDFVVYLGDPDEGASSVSSHKAIEKAEEYKAQLKFHEGVYGAVTVEKNGKVLGEKKHDPVLQLVTSFIRSVPYIIDGEPETALLSESEYGFLFEPSGDDLILSCFAGDAYEPDEYLIEHEQMPLESFADQVVAMGERLVSLIKKVDATALKDDYAKTLTEFLDTAKSALKTFKLERERGVRR
jgi:hypothetical protein